MCWRWAHLENIGGSSHFVITSITPARSLLPCKTKYFEVPSIGMWTSLESYYSANHTICPSGFSICQHWRMWGSIVYSQKETHIIIFLIYVLLIHLSSIEQLSCNLTNRAIKSRVIKTRLQNCSMWHFIFNFSPDTDKNISLKETRF